MGVNIGDISIPFVSTFSVDKSSKPTEQIKHLGNVPPHVAEFQADVLKFIMDGTLFQASGDVRDVDQYAEDITALVERFGVYNSIYDYQGRSGWLIIDSGDSDKSADSVLIRDYSLGGRFMPKNKYQARMHTAPAILSNDFSFSLGVDDCDNYIAIPIGATYSGGDGSTITRTSKDGDITLVLGTSDSDIKWDIGEDDRLNGECKIFDEMGATEYTADLTSGMTFSASTIYDASTNADKAFDDLVGTYWFTGTIGTVVGEWIKVDFGVGNLKKIGKITIKASSNKGFNSFKLQGSNNDADWTDTYSGTASNNNDVQTFVFSNDIDYRYYRIYCVSGYVGTQLGISEIEMMEYSFNESDWVQVYSIDREFEGKVVIENALYRIIFDPANEYIIIYYWSGSAYTNIDDFTAGTYTRATITKANPDIIQVKLNSGVEIEMRRGHPPMIDTDTTDLLCVSLTPADQSTTTENYLVLGANIYICSDESFSLVNATKNCDDGKKWIFYETVGATAEDISHQAMVDQNLNRELIAR